jgi:4-hydroxythreonine-4-phosphate dehydrogenase
MLMTAMPRMLLVAGDPTGIGPEITAKLLAMPETRETASITLLGDPEVFADGANAAGLPQSIFNGLPLIEYRASGAPYAIAQVSRQAGAFTLGCLRAACEQIRARETDGLLFAPLNKQAMKLAGLEQEDEMHFFAHVLGVSTLCSEINIADSLWTTRVTSHVPLRDIANLVTTARIHAVIDQLNTMLRRDRREPRIGVAALNPHAGEGGLLGTEEIDVIAPAVERARAAGVLAFGPLPPDTMFVRARKGEFDAIVTMYHDQGQIATKLLGFERGVTLQAGLPVPVVTPAHGTAFDIAGKGIANPGAIREAFRVGCQACRAS